VGLPRDGSGRLFITEHGGTIRVLTPEGEVVPFLDIITNVPPDRMKGIEDGKGTRLVTVPSSRYVALSIADDVAYGTGVCLGCLRRRDLGALLPRFTGPIQPPTNPVGAPEGS